MFTLSGDNADRYNAFNVYRRELAPGTVSLTGDRAQGDDSKHWAYSSVKIMRRKKIQEMTIWATVTKPTL